MKIDNEKTNDFSIPVPTFIIVAFIVMIVSGVLVPFIPKLAVIPFGLCGVVLVVYSFYIMGYILPDRAEKNDQILKEYKNKQDQ